MCYYQIKVKARNLEEINLKRKQKGQKEERKEERKGGKEREGERGGESMENNDVLIQGGWKSFCR